ncbi:MAG: uracil-DNA glycosylase [Bacteroidetes bacterium]|nr:uracil-DNA glycosylase [Bacteroidota bacterium]
MDKKLSDSVKHKIIQSLIDQKDIFGDELLEKVNIKLEKKMIVDNSVNDTEDSDNNDWINSKTLEQLDTLINTCSKCTLAKNRTNFVFGSGNPNADVMIIGEGPGAEEDKQGLPFVGRAGKLLTDILKAINFTRDEVFIANVVKCRPPANRTPLPIEMEMCIPYLKKQIELIRPKLILCLGRTAAQGILKMNDSLGNMRGKFFDFENAKVMVTYHPAALLRNPHWKRATWEDVQKFRVLYDKLLEK